MKKNCFGKLFITVFINVFMVMAMPGLGLAADVIKLGVAGPHSGDLASYGIPSVNAAKLVVKDINAKGGVLGKQVELFVEDDVCKPEVATNTATKLLSQKVDVVLGHICSGATKAALGIYKDAKIIVMSPSATNPALTQSGDYPNFYRTIASDLNAVDVDRVISATFVVGSAIAVIGGLSGRLVGSSCRGVAEGDLSGRSRRRRLKTED